MTFEDGCARCGPDVPAVAVFDGEPLCEYHFAGEIDEDHQRTFDDMQDEVDAAIERIVASRPRYQEIRSPLLCGDDE